MLFMTEFWERFAFYGMRWALTLYIVAQFFHGDQAGQGYASRTYGSYLALVYASAIFGGYVADRVLGYQRSILVGAAVMGTGLFLVMVPNQDVFLIGLATVIVGNGLFKPNISSLVGQIYPVGDDRRDRGFTIFYMGINMGGFLAPLVTGWLASVLTDTPLQDNYKAPAQGRGPAASGTPRGQEPHRRDRRDHRGHSAGVPADGQGRRDLHRLVARRAVHRRSRDAGRRGGAP
jgi:POT family proton-dependent oligopeptide transporter